MHSWRVLLLPFIEQDALYSQYDFSEPWDGPNNRKLLSQMPREYRCPSEPRSAGVPGTATNYLAVVGPRTAWPGASGRKLAEFLDGTGNTIVLIEKQGTGVPWMEPRDLPSDEALAELNADCPPLLGVHHHEDFFYDHYGGRNVALADGSVRFVPQAFSREVWAALFTIDDKEPRGIVGARDLIVRANSKRLKLGNCYRLAVFVVVVLFPLPWVWRNRGETSRAPLIAALRQRSLRVSRPASACRPPARR